MNYAYIRTNSARYDRVEVLCEDGTSYKVSFKQWDRKAKCFRTKTENIDKTDIIEFRKYVR